MYAKKVKRKKKNQEEEIIYTQVIQLNLNNFSFIGNDKIVDIYCVQNDEKLKLTDKLIFIQIYIPNLIRKWYTVGTQNLEEFERYLLALVLPSIDESFRIGEGVPIMEEYVEEAIEVSDDDNLLEAYDKEWGMKEYGKELGIEEGREIGIEEGKKAAKLEIAKALLNSNMSIEEVSKYTKIPIEELKTIL